MTSVTILGAGTYPGASVALGEVSDRSRELLSYSCASRAGEHRLTLFANGTVRLRERDAHDAAWEMSLLELSPEQLAGYRARLDVQPYDPDGATPEGGPSGEWVEQCRLTMRGPASQGGTTYRFSRIEAIPLDLVPLLGVADELLVRARASVKEPGFPAGYRPQRGDVLVRADGERFRIERFTADESGLELLAESSPLVLYISVKEVKGAFAGVVGEGDGE